MDEDQLFLRSSERPGAKRQSAEAEFIMGQIARLPTRWELTKYAFVILAVGALLGSWRPRRSGAICRPAVRLNPVPVILAIVSRASDKHPGYTSRR
jgi:hypothetical protein